MQARKSSRHTAANVLMCLAVAGWVLAALVATLDWHDAVSGRAIALVALAAALTAIATCVNTRQAEGRVARRVDQAPRDQYYRGYGDCADDVLGSQD